jgi:hypothetical protein
MAQNESLTATYEALPKIAKILIQLFLGYFVSVVYRILKYLETKNTVTLVAGVVALIGLGFVFWVIDLVTEILNDRITFLAD